MTNKEIETLKSAIENHPARSAWARGVRLYALEIVDNIADVDVDLLASSNLFKRQALNGADNWSQYSWGGCSLVYDGDIAERVCTPSELKRTDGGRLRPNSREDWLDVQARALFQAYNVARMEFVNIFSR